MVSGVSERPVGHSERPAGHGDTLNAAPSTSVGAVRGLRANSFAAIVILLVEYGLGVWVNLYGRLPARDHGAGLATGVGRAISNGPVALSIHAVLGLVLVVSAITALVRSILVRRPVLIAATALGLAAVVAAGLSGARFVGHGDNGSAIGMAAAAGVAIGAYAFVLFVSASQMSRNRAGRSHT